MNDELIGIALIIAFIFVGFISGGKIFDFDRTKGSSSTQQEDYLLMPNQFARSSNSSNRTGSNNPNIRSITENANSLTNSFQTYIESQNASVHKGKVEIVDVKNRGTFEEYVTLRANLDDEETLNINNWKIRSTITGSEITLDGAADIPYEDIRTVGPIDLRDRDKVIVSQDPSPIGTSFRLNQCIGYLERGNNFQPSVSSWCPRPLDDVFVSLPEDCLDYIRRIPRCEAPRDVNFPDDMGYSCKNYIKTHVNYESCVANHRYDSDFYKNEWRIYGNNPRILWKAKQDHIQLLDSVGKVVDSVTY